MTDEYRTDSQRLEQQLVKAYEAYRNYIDSNPYPSSEDEWADHDRYRDAVSEASTAWGRYCSDNKHLR